MHVRPILLFCCLFSLNLFAAGVSSQAKTNIAVSDLAGQGVDQASSAIIGDRLRTELFNTGVFKVLERQSMQDILKEQGFQQAGCTSDQCMVEIGQLLGVSQIISGTVGKLGGMFTLNIRMIEVKTGEIVYTTSVDCRCAIEDVLTKSVPSIAGKIAASVGKPVAAVTEAPLAAKTPQASLPPAHTKAWKDSIESARRAAEAVASTGKPQKKHSIVPKIVFGVLAIGSGVAGVVINNLENKKVDHDTELKNSYAASGYSNTSYYQGELERNSTAARSLNTMRNACYILAGACTVGFAVSFAF